MEPPAITRRDVEHLAELAALSLAHGEAEAMARELAKIVAYVKELSAVDTTEVDAAAARAEGGTGERSAPGWREDVVTEGLSHDAAIGGAARVADGGFRVPGYVGGVGARTRARDESER